MSNLLKRAQHFINTGQFTDAEELCRKALGLPGPTGAAKKMLAESLYNQGVMLSYSGMLSEAETCFLSALEQNPKHALALNNLGILAYRSGKIETAITHYRNALLADSRNLLAMRNLATSLQNLDQLDEAAALFNRLARIDATNAGLYAIRNATLIRSIVPDLSYPSQVRERMNTLLDDCLRSKQRGRIPESLAAPYFFLSYHGKGNKELHTKIAQAYLQACPSLAWTAPHVARGRSNRKRVKIGILSANMFNHSIGHTTRGLVEHLDNTLFEVAIIRLGYNPDDAIARAIDAAADSVTIVNTENLGQAHAQIAELELDILFYQDIGMEPLSYLLAFARLAPVQVTSFGHPDTTGIPNMDYFISSDLYEPEDRHEHYSETLVTVPNAGTLSYYYRPEPPSDLVPRSEFGLNEEETIYICPQTLFKIHPDMDAALLGIAQRDPKARIVFIEPAKSHLRYALEERWNTFSRDVFERITFIKRLQHKEYLRLISCADVMLDTVHFNGQNTNLEAFSVGIPVVTWPGSMQRGRHTLGMYKKMGETLFRDLIASDADDYAAKAVRVATDPIHRKNMKARIAENRSALYEDVDFVRSCETLFIDLLNRSK